MEIHLTRLIREARSIVIIIAFVSAASVRADVALASSDVELLPQARAADARLLVMTAKSLGLLIQEGKIVIDARALPYPKGRNDTYTYTIPPQKMAQVVGDVAKIIGFRERSYPLVCIVREQGIFYAAPSQLQASEFSHINLKPGDAIIFISE